MNRFIVMLAPACLLTGCSLPPTVNLAAVNSSMKNDQLLELTCAHIRPGTTGDELGAELDGMGLQWGDVGSDVVSDVRMWVYKVPGARRDERVVAAWLLPEEYGWFRRTDKVLRFGLDEQGRVKSIMVGEHDAVRSTVVSQGCLMVLAVWTGLWL